MPEVATLREDLGKVISRLNSITESYKVGSMPADKRTECDALVRKGRELQTEISEALKVEERKADLQSLDDFLNKPQNTIPHGVEGDQGEGSDERKALARAGWEFKGGSVIRHTSMGPLEMYSDEVLFGPIPEDDPTAAAYFKSTRAAMGAPYRKAYERLLRMTARAPFGMSGINFLSIAEQKALSEGLDPSGGFLVPPDVQAELLVRTAQMAVFRSNARVQNTSRDVLRWPKVAAASATAGGLSAGGGSVFSSGFIGSWVGEVPSTSDVDPTFEEFDVIIRKLRIQTRLSNDFIADSAVNVLAFLAENGAENMSLVEDSAFFVGTGIQKPTGILDSGSGVATVDVEGTTANTISSTAGDAGSARKTITLAYTLPAQYAGGAKWYMRRNVEGKYRGLINAAGGFHFMENGYGGAPRTILGFGVENTDFMADDGTDANRVVLFGNLRNAYIIGQRAQITSTVLRERYADTDQTGIILFERVGGSTWNPDAARIGIV